MIQIIRHLPSKHEALSSISSTTKKRKGGRERGKKKERKHLFLTVLKTGEYKDKVTAQLVSGESSLLIVSSYGQESSSLYNGQI
jgi:hypothetical protein